MLRPQKTPESMFCCVKEKGDISWAEDRNPQAAQENSNSKYTRRAAGAR